MPMGAPADIEVAWRGHLRVTVFDGGTVPDLGRILAAGDTAAYVDSACAGQDRLPADAGEFVLVLSTAAAARLDVADAFAAAAGERFPELRDDQLRVHEALQEAVANAVMHGNLALDGSLRATLSDLRSYAAEMERRLHDPAYAERAVTISALRRKQGIAVRVEDSGNGFTPPPPHAFRLSAGGGNGLAIIRSCCRRVTFSRGGRRITMLFRDSVA